MIVHIEECLQSRRGAHSHSQQQSPAACPSPPVFAASASSLTPAASACSTSETAATTAVATTAAHLPVPAGGLEERAAARNKDNQAKKATPARNAQGTSESKSTYVAMKQVVGKPLAADYWLEEGSLDSKTVEDILREFEASAVRPQSALMDKPSPPTSTLDHDTDASSSSTQAASAVTPQTKPSEVNESSKQLHNMSVEANYVPFDEKSLDSRETLIRLRNMSIYERRRYLREQEASRYYANNLLNHSLQLKIKLHMPPRYKFSDKEWKLLYSTQFHNRGVCTFQYRAKQHSPTLLLVEDSHKQVFGAFVTGDWTLRGGSYCGTGESFVFSVSPEFVVYPWTRSNDYFNISRQDWIAVGGGSNFAIWLDEHLSKGSSGSCDTFGNTTVLSSSEYFDVNVVELWAVDPTSVKQMK